MITSEWETDLAEAEGARLETEPGEAAEPGLVDTRAEMPAIEGSVRELREELAMLQAEQERGLDSLGGALQQIGHELSIVRTQLAALAEPILAGDSASEAAAAETTPKTDHERAETEQRLERIERQVALLLRGLDSVEGLRHQSDVHTRALARLTDLLGEVVRPRPVEGLAPLQLAVAALEESQQRQARLQTATLVAFGLGLLPGLVALGWLIARAVGP